MTNFKHDIKYESTPVIVEGCEFDAVQNEQCRDLSEKIAQIIGAQLYSLKISDCGLGLMATLTSTDENKPIDLWVVGVSLRDITEKLLEKLGGKEVRPSSQSSSKNFVPFVS